MGRRRREDGEEDEIGWGGRGWGGGERMGRRRDEVGKWYRSYCCRQYISGCERL